MRVGIFLINRLPPTEGGAFSFYERLIHSIDNYAFDSSVEICFVGREPQADIRLKKKYIQLGSYFFRRMFDLSNRLRVLPYLSDITQTDLDLCNRKDKGILKKNGIDVLLYPKQAYQQVWHFPFISMNWDIGHKSTYAFPEMIYDANFEVRTAWYTQGIQRAMAVFVESEYGKRELSHYCAMPLMKFHVIPMFPGRVVEMSVDEGEQHNILGGLSLAPGSYFYYPAQYWAHKNHYNLLLAFRQLKDRQPGRNLKLVFTGADFGNKAYILSVIAGLGLSDDVVTLKFVSNEELYTLYKNSIALVMPTFLGPTNMPLLEARALGVPVICSDLEGHHEQCGDGALYARPDYPEDWVEAMDRMLRAELREEIRSKAAQEHARSIFTLQNATLKIEEALLQLKRVRKTFN